MAQAIAHLFGGWLSAYFLLVMAGGWCGSRNRHEIYPKPKFSCVCGPCGDSTALQDFWVRSLGV